LKEDNDILVLVVFYQNSVVMPVKDYAHIIALFAMESSYFGSPW